MVGALNPENVAARARV